MYLTESKTERVVNAVREIVKSKGRHITTKTLARALGKMILIEAAVGKFTFICSRLVYRDLERAVDKQGRHSTLRISEEAADSMVIFIDKLQEFIRMVYQDRGISSFGVVNNQPSNGIHEVKSDPNNVGDVPSEILACDASGFAACAYGVRSEKDAYYIRRLLEQETELPSGQRELLTVKYSLEHYQERYRAWETSHHTLLVNRLH